jgi:uridine kinase
MAMMTQDINNVADAIKAEHPKQKPVLIAVEGYGGSGKTTLANELSNALGKAYVVHLDDFIVKEKMNEPSWESGFDRKRLEEQVLAPASAGKSVNYQTLLWVSNSLSQPSLMPPVDYLIVEGISSSHPDISHYYQFVIWMDTPIEVAKARGQARDAGNENEHMWDLWAENDIRYQDKYHPEKKANFTVRGY